MTNSYEEKESLYELQKWENTKIIFFGQILGIVQIILTVVTVLFIVTIVYIYNNFRISDLLQSAVVINIMIVLTVGFISLVTLFLIMYIKIFISCIYSISTTQDRKTRWNYIKILLLPAFFTFYLAKKLVVDVDGKKVKFQKNSENQKMIENKELDKIENKVSN